MTEHEFKPGDGYTTRDKKPPLIILKNPSKVIQDALRLSA